MPGRDGIAAAPLQTAGIAKSQPLSKKQLIQLLTGGVPSQRAAELVRDRGIDFEVDEDDIRELRRAGATDVLLTAVRKASVVSAQVTVETSPNARVFLDGILQGQADSLGVLMMRPKNGAHTLKVTLAGKQDLEQNLTVTEGQLVRVVAPLADLTGSLRLKAQSGATVWLDDFRRGSVDASGQFLLSGIPPGAHKLKVTAPGKVDDSRDLNVVAGLENQVEVVLAEGVRVNPQDGLKYSWIPAGTFLMGCSAGDNDCADAEKPARPVTLQRGFWIAQTETTTGAYRRYVQANGKSMPTAAPKINRGWKVDNLPIVDVTWFESNQYCVWIGGRLPSEAEWEFAARGGIAQPRYGALGDIAWTKENAGGQTHLVALKLPNAYGLFDTLGNVWEWINDWYDPNYYKSGSAMNPMGPAEGQQRGLRGGAWIFDDKLLRASDRYGFQPDVRSDFFGFRCVWEPKGQ